MIRIIAYTLILWMINLFRQVSYIINSKEKDPTEFIDAYDSVYLHKKKRYLQEYIKELGLSFIFVLIAYYLSFPYLVFGISFDAFQDILIAFFGNFYRKISNNRKIRQLLREFLVPYILFPIIMYILNVNIETFLFCTYPSITIEFLLSVMVKEHVKSNSS